MEFELIRQLQQREQQRGAGPRVRLGIGDDCAILPGGEHDDLLVTADLLLDGVHFLTDRHSFAQIARKSLAVSVSDVAAMGGEPTVAFLSLALPRSWTAAQASRFFECLTVAAEEFEVAIAGGDTTTWTQGLAVNVTLHGRVPRGEACLRSGAKAGDILCVSGPLGGSIFGRQFSFPPRVAEARWLREQGYVSAMLDLSDGLISDVQHLLTASQTGAEIYLEQIPLSTAVDQHADGKPAVEHALADGEDFELLWTMSPEHLEQLQQQADVPVQVFPIGKIVAGQGCRFLDAEGKPQQLQLQGYVHQLQTES